MEQIDDITECCICAEMFTDPRMLPCIHTFCLKCLEATRSKSEKNPGDTMPCPICRQKFAIPPDGLSGFQKNFFMERLMEIAKISKPLKTAVSCYVCLINKDDTNIEVPDASNHCVQCRENMCEICSVQHKRQKFSRYHQIVPFGDQLIDELVKTSVAAYCNQHDKEELKMYCADCKKVICIMCFAESHQLHKCSDVKKAADAFRDEIGIFLARVVDGSNEALAQEFKLEEEKIKFMEESEIAETAIKERANELKQLIDKHADDLLDELVQTKAARMKETENKKEEIERYRAIVNSFNAYCSEIKSKGTPTDICRSVNDLRARSNELQEISAVQIKQDSSAVHISLKTSAIEDILKVDNIVGSLGEQHAYKSIATLKTNTEEPVSIDFIERIQCPINVQAVTKLEDRTYVLGLQTIPLFDSGTSICIFEDGNPCQVYKHIQIREILDCQHVVSSDELKCIYISDTLKRCIWKLTADDCRVSQWLPIESGSFTLSVSNDGHLLLLRGDKGVSQLQIYGSDAKIIQSVSLSHVIMKPLHIIQESNGQFLIIHKAHDSRRESWVISELNSEGQILRQFQAKGRYQKLVFPYHLSLDSENNRLYVAQKHKFKFNVAMFDLGSLEWSQILLTSESPYWQLRLHYDEHKKQLLVGKAQEVTVYKIY